jgi:hypothetical protein
MADDERLDKLLHEWYKIKAQVSLLEKREADIKELVTDLMNQQGRRMIQTQNFVVSKRTQKRSGISQRDVPEEIWNRYSKKIEYGVFSLKRLN